VPFAAATPSTPLAEPRLPIRTVAAIVGRACMDRVLSNPVEPSRSVLAPRPPELSPWCGTPLFAGAAKAVTPNHQPQRCAATCTDDDMPTHAMMLDPTVASDDRALPR
jgi:hypothetical protein